MSRIVVPIGVRPHAAKAVCLARAAAIMGIKAAFILTGQQTEILERILNEEDRLAVSAHLIAEFHEFSYRIAVDRICENLQPNDVVLSIGDTKSSLCGALAAKKMSARLFHYESGLRSRMNTIEEKIRRKIDSISDFHLCYNSDSVDNLINEGISGESISVVGSLYEESLSINLGRRIADHCVGNNIIISLHRKENRLDRSKARFIIDAIRSLHENKILIIHPSNSQEYINAFRGEGGEWRVINEMKTDVFASYLCRASLVITDSAGIAEQSTLLMVPTVVVREDSERPWMMGSWGKLSSFESIGMCVKAIYQCNERIVDYKLASDVSRKILEEIVVNRSK